ncbi:MAG: hypothetical protein E6G10_22780 [Actinobacteria bacterium]|nr:MAG: hypothetical protein E6G10_22780 [Actinomycetota bacterium]
MSVTVLDIGAGDPIGILASAFARGARREGASVAHIAVDDLAAPAPRELRRLLAESRGLCLASSVDGDDAVGYLLASVHPDVLALLRTGDLGVRCAAVLTSLPKAQAEPTVRALSQLCLRLGLAVVPGGYSGERVPGWSDDSSGVTYDSGGRPDEASRKAAERHGARFGHIVVQLAVADARHCVIWRDGRLDSDDSRDGLPSLSGFPVPRAIAQWNERSP